MSYMQKIIEERNIKIRAAYQNEKISHKREDALEIVAVQFGLSKWTISEIVYPRNKKSKTVPKA